MSPHQQSHQLMIHAWQLMVGRLPNSRITSKDGLTATFANTPLAFFNLSFYENPIPTLAQLEAVLAQAKADASHCPHHWMHLISDDNAPSGWQAALANSGFAPVIPLTGMECDNLFPPTRPLASLEWRLVTGPEGATDIAHLNALAYDMPTQLFGPLCNMNLWHQDSLALVGYLDDQPITAAAALPVDGTIYLALVATHPDHRSKGYAEACLRQLIAAAAPHMQLSSLTLHASAAGLPVYQRMGFVPTGNFTLLAPTAAS